jgi:hypothetical protein
MNTQPGWERHFWSLVVVYSILALSCYAVLLLM